MVALLRDIRIPKPNKYRAVKSEADGIWFASKKERDRYLQLKILERVGEIGNLTLQPAFPLIVNDVKVATYKGDFGYRDFRTDCEIVEDAKGFKTPAYRLKKKLMKAIYGIEVREV